WLILQLYGYVEDEEYPPYCLKRSDSSGSVTESSISSQSEHGSNSSTFSYEEHCGPGLRSFLVKRLSSHLSVLDFSPLHLERMTSDILRLSESEPYGIRGATLIFKVFDPKGKQDFKIPPLKIDAGCVSTFRLIFNLKEESLLISNIGEPSPDSSSHGDGTERRVGNHLLEYHSRTTKSPKTVI
ncbi:DNA damageinducible transcript 4like proteinlike, partial [Caligus rogercresseyi]